MLLFKSKAIGDGNQMKKKVREPVTPRIGEAIVVSDTLSAAECRHAKHVAEYID
jgi:hypothetical protein